jgi:hypothetical protein
VEGAPRAELRAGGCGRGRPAGAKIRRARAGSAGGRGAKIRRARCGSAPQDRSSELQREHGRRAGERGRRAGGEQREQRESDSAAHRDGRGASVA